MTWGDMGNTHLLHAVIVWLFDSLGMDSIICVDMGSYIVYSLVRIFKRVWVFV